jgi:transcriptional regulator with XRE-family HTH domain
MIHIGSKIKEELYKQGIPVSVFAKRIGRSRNSIYDLFERQSVDMVLLAKIGAVLKVDFLSLYDQSKYPQPEDTAPVVSEPGEEYNQQLLDLLEQKIRLMEMEFQLLKRELALLRTAHK